MGVLRPDLLIKCIVPVVMAGIIAIYGLVVSVLISGDLKSPMTLYSGFIQLGAGLSVGLSGLAAGFAIGVVGDAGVRGTAQQPRLFIGMVSGGGPKGEIARRVADENITPPRNRRFSFSFSPRSWVCTVSSSPSSSTPARRTPRR